MDPVADVLEHFGVRGMRWGVRRTRAQLGTSPSSFDAAKAHHVQGTIKRHGLGAVSNEELRLLNDRIGLETKYHQLRPQKKTLIQKGASAASGILVSVGQQQAKNYLNKSIGLKIDAELGKPTKFGKHSREK